MYTPKLTENNVRDLYRLAKRIGKPMTVLTNEMIRHMLDNYDTTVVNGSLRFYPKPHSARKEDESE